MLCQRSHKVHYTMGARSSIQRLTMRELQFLRFGHEQALVVLLLSFKVRKDVVDLR